MVVPRSDRPDIDSWEPPVAETGQPMNAGTQLSMARMDMYNTVQCYAALFRRRHVFACTPQAMFEFTR